MAKQTINIGLAANDNTGDQLRTAFDKTNDNFDEIYGGIASVVRQSAPPTLIGVTGDIAGMIAYGGGIIYVCIANFDNINNIWVEHEVLNIDAHVADGTIHFTEAAIDHANILSIGTNSHGVIDSTLADIQAGAGTVVRQTAPANSFGATGDEAGMMAYDSAFIYFCVTNYTVGAIDIWDRVAVTSITTNWS